MLVFHLGLAHGLQVWAFNTLLLHASLTLVCCFGHRSSVPLWHLASLIDLGSSSPAILPPVPCFPPSVVSLSHFSLFCVNFTHSCEYRHWSPWTMYIWSDIQTERWRGVRWAFCRLGPCLEPRSCIHHCPLTVNAADGECCIFLLLLLLLFLPSLWL